VAGLGEAPADRRYEHQRRRDDREAPAGMDMVDLQCCSCRAGARDERLAGDGQAPREHP
jgi:hypothetical protein